MDLKANKALLSLRPLVMVLSNVDKVKIHSSVTPLVFASELPPTRRSWRVLQITFGDVEACGRLSVHGGLNEFYSELYILLSTEVSTSM